MSDVQTNFNAFYAAEATLSSATPATITGRSVYRFNPPYGTTRIPIHIRTGSQSLQNMHDYKQYDASDPVARKKFQQLEFHGKGALYVRVYVDGIWIADGTINMSETPDKERRMGLPVGTRGYVVDVEFCGDADIRALEFTYDHMPSPS